MKISTINPNVKMVKESKEVDVDAFPGIDESHPKHDQYVKSLAAIKDVNPDLYKKIMNWD